MTSKIKLSLTVIVCIGLYSCAEKKESSKGKTSDIAIQEMIASEELILKLTPKLRALANSMITGKRNDLPEEIATEASIAPWDHLEPDHQWKSASFGTLSAEFKDGDFHTKTKFEGVRRGKNGVIVGVKAKQKLIWKKQSSEEGKWQLVKWIPLSFEKEESAQPLFEEVLDKVIPDSVTRSIARTSYHEEILRKTFKGEQAKVGKFTINSPRDGESTYQYPAVSVVDYDCDGHEDFFLTSRWVPPQLFRNLGNGTYQDVTMETGLSPYSYVTAAVFADFDNDGDPDALLGRSFGHTLYYRNDGGKFVDVTESATDLGKLYLVSAMAVSDVNNDGLLDVYLSTYSPVSDINNLKHEILSPKDVKKLDQIFQTSTPFLDERGVPNVLLMNRGGGRLERAGGEVVELWRKSYQPLWFDADNDGDEDLYVCNDFGPDTFLRNDTPAGASEPVFVEKFAEVFPDGVMAFGMGVSCGDYDNDGDLDLFVSNMYSKAGNRIVPAFEKTDPRIIVAARGNFLYRNDNGVFHQVAETDAAETKVGWAFGGQFADFNNDGWLDLYVPSGLYTAPKEVATEVDL